MTRLGFTGLVGVFTESVQGKETVGSSYGETHPR